MYILNAWKNMGIWGELEEYLNLEAQLLLKMT